MRRTPMSGPRHSTRGKRDVGRRPRPGTTAGGRRARSPRRASPARRIVPQDRLPAAYWNGAPPQHRRGGLGCPPKGTGDGGYHATMPDAPPAPIIREARRADAKELARLRWEFTAELRDQLIGTIWVERVDKVPRPYERPLHWGYVTNVYVAPEFRSAGIGRRLLDAATAQARSAGWQLLLLWPSERSGAFYARAGFRLSAESLELDLLGDGVE